MAYVIDKDLLGGGSTKKTTSTTTKNNEASTQKVETSLTSDYKAAKAAVEQAQAAVKAQEEEIQKWQFTQRRIGDALGKQTLQIDSAKNKYTSAAAQIALQGMQTEYDQGVNAYNLAKQQMNSAVQKYSSAYKNYETALDSFKSTVRRTDNSEQIQQLTQEKTGLQKVNAQLQVDSATLGSFGSVGSSMIQQTIQQNAKRINEIDTELSALKSGTIAGDIEDADTKISELEKQIQSLDKLNKQLSRDGISAGLGTGYQLIQQQIAQNATVKKELEKELAQLKEDRELLLEEQEWAGYLKWADYADAEDFAELSAYKSTNNGQKARMGESAYTLTGFDDLTYDYINRNQQATKIQQTQNQTWDQSYLEQMTDDEISIYNYVYAKEGQEKANEYLDYLRSTLNARNRAQTESQAAEMGKTLPVTSSLLSVAASPLKGLSFVGQTVDKLIDGKIDENANYYKYSYTNDAIRNSVSDTVEEKWGPVGSFAYGLGMSMADSIFNRSISGHSTAVVDLIMSSNAAVDGTVSAKERGLSDNQAYTLGIIAGIAESLMESIGIDEMLEGVNPDKSKVLQWLSRKMPTELAKFAIDASAEGLEEVGTSLIDVFADVLIAKDKSEWQESINAYQQTGLDKKTAFCKALKDELMSLTLDFAGGAISGTLFSGAEMILDSASNGKTGQRQARVTGEKAPQAAAQAATGATEPTAAQRGLTQPEETAQQGGVTKAQLLNNLRNAPPVPEVNTAIEQIQNAKTDDEAVEVYKKTPFAGSEELRNGGSINDNESNQWTAGNNVSDGGQEWLLGQRTGEQAGHLGENAVQTPDYTKLDQGNARTQRRNTAKTLRLEAVSSREIGIASGTDTKNIQVLPENAWDVELQQIAQSVRNETGKEVTFVLGKIEFMGKNSVSYAGGVVIGDSIYVRVDHPEMSATQIADHESYHAKAAANPELNQQIFDGITKQYSAEEFDEILTKYITVYGEVYGYNSPASMEDFEWSQWKIIEEILADAYAGFNAFGKNASKYSAAVNQTMMERGIRKGQTQSNGTKQTTAPPSDQYKSGVPQSANAYSLGATLEAESANTPDENIEEIGRGVNAYNLGQARMYQAMGVDADTIYQETGIRFNENGDPASERGDHSAIRQGQRMSEGNIQAVQSIGRKSVNSFTTEEIKATERLAQQHWKEMGVKSPFFRAWFGDWRANDQAPIQIADQQGDARGAQRNEDTGWDIQVSGKVFNETRMHTGPVNRRARAYLPYINDIIKKAVLLDTYGMGEAKSGNSLLMHNLYAVADIGNGPELLKLYVEEMNDPNADQTAKRAYQLQNIESQQLSAKGSGVSPSPVISTADIQSVADLFTAVKRRDSNFQPKPASKAVNEDGTPKIYYHGTNADWYTYDLSKNVNQMWGDGIYLAETAERARAYGDRVIPLYVQALYNNRDAKRLGTQRDHIRRSNGDLLVFSPDQIKSATENTGTFDGNNPDIRYSIDDTADISEKENIISTYNLGQARMYQAMDVDADTIYQETGIRFDENGEPVSRQQNISSDDRYSMDDGSEDSTDLYAQTEQEWKERQEKVRQERRERQNQERKSKNAFFEEKLGKKGYKDYRKAKKAENRKLQKDALRVQGPPNVEAAPTRAKGQLRHTLMSLFSVPEGRKAEIGTMIDQYADRLISKGSLTEEDRNEFFDRMYEAGVMEVPAEAYYADARNYIAGGKVYVTESIKAEFGDDWNAFRARAFAAGVYLTDDQNNTGVDVWNADLADLLPGLFNAEETDSRTILENIVDVAEEGRNEKVSLAEYTARMAKQEYVSESEFLDAMEQHMDWALRTFAEKADLEVTLKKQSKMKELRNQAQRREKTLQQREKKELRELQNKTLKSLQWLSRNRNRAPEDLKAKFDEVLGDIDIYAVGAANESHFSKRYNATWKDLGQMFKDAKEYDPNFLPSPELERIVDRLDNEKIADMDVDAVNDLYKAAVALKTEFENRNKVINDEKNRRFSEVYKDSRAEIEAAPGRYTGKKTDKLFNMDQLTPMNVMQRMVGWNPDSTFYSMAKQLEQGERDMRAYKVKAERMLQDFLNEHKDWVKRADGQGKDAIWYDVEVPELMELHMGDKPIFSDKTVTISFTPAQRVHMYLESKNYDNLRHMTGGRTFVNKELYSQGKRQEALSQGTTVRLAPETVQMLIKDMPPEEKELAQLLDNYYNSFAKEEINKVSNLLYGYDKAMGKNYAPIYTNRNYTKAEFGVFDQTAEGVGNLKGRQYAKNPSYNISAFDAFERHVDQTARFCGMAIPARNWTTLMNWREDKSSTGDVITHKWGEEGKQYIANLITTLQSGRDFETDTISSSVDKLMSNYISAVFGANPSIVLKQLGSIPMASAYLGMNNVPNLTQIQNIDTNLISKYTQDLQWRTMGYSMPETKQLKDNPNWTQSNKIFGFVFGGDAITAMDGWAASTLWPWAENKVRREYPDLKMGTQADIDNGISEFYKKVAEEFENAVARSQSTSDEIHQSQQRKSSNPIAKTFTMFKSDSAQTYNAVRQMIGETQYHKRAEAEARKQWESTKKEQFEQRMETEAKARRKSTSAAGAAFLALLANATLSECIDLLMNLWKHKGKRYRDDEDELTAESVLSKMAYGWFGNIAGTVTYGEELADLVGSIITGDTWWGIENMGLEVLNEVIDLIWEKGAGMREIISEAVNIGKNDGSVMEYFKSRSGDIRGDIKDIASGVCTYLLGLPAENVEAFLLGTVEWISPELHTAYEDALSTAKKNGLSGLEGDALATRVGNILENHGVNGMENTAQALAELYEAGYTAVVPSDTPTDISVDGEKHTLNAYQQQLYNDVWGSCVEGVLDDLVASADFADADPETQSSMIRVLYDYAADRAKAELFENFEPEKQTELLSELKTAKANMSEAISVLAQISQLDKDDTISGAEKSNAKRDAIAECDLTEEQMKMIYRTKIPDSRDEGIQAFEDAGLSFTQFLEAQNAYSTISEMDISESEMATELSRWVNSQGYTDSEAETVKEVFKYYNRIPAEATGYEKALGVGLPDDMAYEFANTLSTLEPLDDADSVADVQKWRAAVDLTTDLNQQMQALSAVMDENTYQKVEIAYSYDIAPSAYVRLKEVSSLFNEDGAGSLKNDEWTAAINAICTNDLLEGTYSNDVYFLTTAQKAALWQLCTGSTSSKNNPYSSSVGAEVIATRKALKEAAEESE